MPLVPAKCPDCGGLVEVDNEKRAGLCQHCGQPFVIEDAIQTFNTYYQTTNNYNTTHNYGDGAVVNVYENQNSISVLMERACLFLEDGDFTYATKYFDKVLDADPGCADAYLGKLMAELRVKKLEELKNCAKPFENNNNYQKVLRFGEDSLKETLISYVDFINTRNDEYKHQAELARIEIERKKIEAINFHKQKTKQCSSYSTRIITGQCNTMGIKSDGTVVAVGLNDNGQCNVSDWTDIVAISAGLKHTVGLKSNGTVATVGSNKKGQCNVSKWSNIVAVSASECHTVGLKSDGTVVATKIKIGLLDIPYGRDIVDNGQCNVSNWTDIVAISAGLNHTVGLKSDGTVIATKYIGDMKYYKGQCEVSNWTDIVAISTGLLWHTVGLKSDGTVVAVGYNDKGQCKVFDWTDIIAISAGHKHTVGLKSDGTVVAVGSNDKGQCNVSDWTDIVAISAGLNHTVGLKSDGTVIATKYIGDMKYYKGQCEVENWKLF